MDNSITLQEIEIAVQKITALESRLDELEQQAISLRKSVKSGGGYDFAEDITGYNRNTLYNKVSQKKIPYEFRLGKPWFERAHLEAWMKDPSYNDRYWEKQLLGSIYK